MTGREVPIEPNTSVDPVFDVLDAISAAGHPLGVAELARQLGLSTSTAHRVLATLQQAGFVGRDVTGVKYQLGLMAHELAEAFFRRFPIRKASAPHLRRLVALTGETVSLDVRVGLYRVCVAGEEGTREIHRTLRVGEALPLGAGAPGLAILAHLSAQQIRRAAADGSPVPGRTLADVRRRGHARDAPGGESGWRVSFPVRSAGKEAIASISIEGATSAGEPRPDDAVFRSWAGVVAELETLVAREPALARQPYEHVDADAIAASLTNPARAVS